MSTLSLHSSRASSSQPGWGNSSGMSESDDERYDSRRGAFFSGDGNDEDSDDDEDAWDEVDVDQDNRISTLSSAAAAAAAAGSEAIEIVIQKGGKQKATKKKPNGSTTRERMVRQERHKVHAICHLAVGLIRNRWLNNPLLKARLVSVVPLNLQRNFTSFNKTTHPNERDRSRMFDHALNELLSWWYQWFDIKWGKEIRRRTVPDVERELEEWGWDTSTSNVPWEGLDAAGEEEDEEVRGAGDVDDSVKKGRSAKSMGKGKGKGKGKAKAKEPPWISSSISSGEPINSVQSLMKHVVNHNGSRDMSAQLFTCACRALDIPARLIFSLQPADWKAPSASAKSWKKKRGDSGKQSEGEAVSTDDGRRGKNSRSARKGDGKMKTNGSGQNKNLKDKVLNLRRGSSSKVSDADSGDDEWVDGRGQLNYTLPPVNLRRSKPARRDPNRSSSPDPKAMSSPPVFWTEVYSRSNRHWISVDPTRKKMRCRGIMEPPRSCVENQLLYVVAFEEDGSARDVTPRYAKSFNTITMKARVPSKKGTDWFADLLKPHARSFQLNRDKDEEEELWNRKVNEPMPTSVAAFKNHPTYVLEQHLHRDETILPGSKKLGVFRGTEIVYARSAVVQLKSEENWRRVGRVVKSDIEIPMKWVKQRTVTINRKRAENLALMDGGEVTQQPLYAESQTKIYIPPPVVNGKIPKNDFGNIDLYVPSMLPEGATHLPHKSAAKCAKTLGIDYAEAVTGFEFRQRRANPIISGVVVAEEFADLLIEAIINTQTAADEKEFLKRQDRVLKRWKKLIIGLRIRQRIQASYHQQPVKAASLAEESQFNRSVAGEDGSATGSLSTNVARQKETAEDLKRAAITNSKKRAAPTDVSPASHSKRSTPTPKPTTRSSSPAIAPAAVPGQTSSNHNPSLTTVTSIKIKPLQPRPKDDPATQRSRSLRVRPVVTPPSPEIAKRSTSGRTLRFTMSTEKAVEAKEKKAREAEEMKIREEEESRKLRAGAHSGTSVTETEVEDEVSATESESSLELDSDF